VGELLCCLAFEVSCQIILSSVLPRALAPERLRSVIGREWTGPLYMSIQVFAVLEIPVTHRALVADVVASHVVPEIFSVCKLRPV
jgi:hypothetical protein